MPTRKRIRSTNKSTITGGGEVIVIPGDSGFVDDFSVAFKFVDSNAAPTDAATYEIAYAESDSNAGQTEEVELKFPVGVYTDTSAAPTETNSFTIVVWMSDSAGAGVTSPANANGQNDGAVATISTSVAGSTTEEMLSVIGANIGAVSFSSCLYRGWFSISTPLITSRGTLTAYSQTTLFPPITMLNFSALGGSVNHSGGTFTFDLFAAGVNTPAKLASLRISHATQDAVAGVTPAVMTVDAGAIELAGVFT